MYKTMSLKFCANLSFMFQEASLLERYRMAKESGFKAVETAFLYSIPLEEVEKVKTNCGLQQILINSPPGDLDKGELGFAAIPGQEEKFRNSIQKSIEYAKALQCKRIHVMAGIVDSPTEENFLTYEKNLLHAVSEFEKNNIVGLIEPINQYSVPKYYLNNFDKVLVATRWPSHTFGLRCRVCEVIACRVSSLAIHETNIIAQFCVSEQVYCNCGLQIVKKINSPNLRLQLDIFHLQQINGNLTRNIETLLPYVGHIQIAQVPDRNEPDTDGEINYSYIFSLLKKLGYDGWIGLEYKPLGVTKEGLKWVKNYDLSL